MTNEKRVDRFCPKCGTAYDDSEVQHCPEDGFRLRERRAGTEDDPLVGEVLDDQFRIESVLGQGAMGRVYVGDQISVGRRVAVKTLRPEVSSGEVVTRRFMREAQVISKISHPNIINLIDFGRERTQEILYLVLELVEGIPLDRLLHEGRIAPVLAVHLAEQLCGGLAEAHGEGIVHRDLKPENVMLVSHSDRRLEAKLLDFGIAHSAHQSDNLTASGAVLGTPYYLAPEQAEGDEVGPYSDLYAVGVILFEMLTGHRPITGGSTMKLLLQHVEGKVPPLGEWIAPGEIPDELVELVDSMTTAAPAGRPGSALEVRNRLRAIKREAGWDDIVVDPSLDQPDEVFEPWLQPPVERPDGAAAPARAGEPHLDGEPATGEADGARESIEVADTLGGSVVPKVDANRAGASVDTERSEKKATPETEVGTEAAEKDLFGGASSRAKRGAALMVGVIGLLALVGGGIYLSTVDSTTERGDGDGPSSKSASEWSSNGAGAAPARETVEGESSSKAGDRSGAATVVASDDGASGTNDAAVAERDAGPETRDGEERESVVESTPGGARTGSGTPARGGAGETVGGAGGGGGSEGAETRAETDGESSAHDSSTESTGEAGGKVADDQGTDGEPSDEGEGASDDENDRPAEPGFFPAE